MAYIRVSTARQGERGVSLQEQRDAIERYARRHGLTISSWFEERETAAKRGRPVFSDILGMLRERKAAGLIVHKIDRSARNLKDWADLGDLIDQGIVVHFANENLDLQSRGGRLSADIQAVVAADYIRNLREESRKGFYGRIKQGLFPLPAPLGYLDKGKGKPKEIDPVSGPLLRKAFELYSTGKYNLRQLTKIMYGLGLRNRHGGKVPLNGFSIAFNNPFYIGLIRLKRTGETFSGCHHPLIPKALFDRVKKVLTGKAGLRVRRHDFLFSRMLICTHCKYSLIGERQKGRYVYYRCHTKNCATKVLREADIEKAFFLRFESLRFTEQEQKYLQQRLEYLKANWTEERKKQIKALQLKKDQLQDRLMRLTDTFIDQLLDKVTFEERKNLLLLERVNIEERLDAIRESETPIFNRLTEFLELACNAHLAYKTGLPEEKRELLKLITSNCKVDGKTLEITFALPFEWVAFREKVLNSAPSVDRPRTLEDLLNRLVAHFKAQPSSRLG